MHILWLKTELLHPVDKGGKIRTYHLLRELKRSHRVTYLTLDDGTADEQCRRRAHEYCDDLICVPHRRAQKFSARFYLDLLVNLFSPVPYFISRYQSLPMRGAIAEQSALRKPDVVVCDFLMPSINVPPNLPCATVLFEHNIEAIIWKRHFETQRNPVKRAYLHAQWRRTYSFEKSSCQRFDQVIAVSDRDRATFEQEYGVLVVRDVPTGVDAAYYRPRDPGCREPHNLVFTGSMDWFPNEDAISYFVGKILPRVKESIPDVKLTVVGRDPSRRLRELSARDSSVVVTGRVDDVRPYLERAAAYVVPLRIGGGTRIKVFEAMAMQKPVVSTSVGAEGLPVIDGQHIILADTPEAFAAGVVRVLTDQQLARDLGSWGRGLVSEQFGWDRAARRFAEICEEASMARKTRVGTGSSEYGTLSSDRERADQLSSVARKCVNGENAADLS
jgi:polysaccharide biosynthesis protein PslH